MKDKARYSRLLLYPRCQLPTVLRLLAIDTRIAILSIRSIQCRKLHYRHHSFLLYGSCLMHPSVLRIFLDSFARKPLYLLAYFIFMTMFAGYIIAGSLTLFILFRIIHGVSFGMVTVGGNTVVIDIMPHQDAEKVSDITDSLTT